MLLLFSMQGKISLQAAIREDFIKTGQCKLTISKNELRNNQALGWALKKNSPHLENFNRG